MERPNRKETTWTQTRRKHDEILGKIHFKDDQFDIATAAIDEQIKQLGASGDEKYDEHKKRALLQKAKKVQTLAKICVENADFKVETHFNINQQLGKKSPETRETLETDERMS